MTNTLTRRLTWSVAREPVGSAVAAELLRTYYTEVSDRYYGRPTTEAEIEQGLTDDPSDDLAPPTGEFLAARYGDEASGCVGLRVLDASTAELTRMFVRPGLRGLGGGSRLLTAAEAAARALGSRRIVLDTRLDLVEARGLYAKHGYGEIPRYNRSRYAEVWFGKELGGSGE
ncbi:GNAT family N-acetyltransferase [Streptomyces sp. NPDC004647]|uniref:GNAT family N-acetyltransferase n=1 Tax=Streptomyces sp. NPDC004647 TaxID=3154671 RepID=UPI0033A09158